MSVCSTGSVTLFPCWVFVICPDSKKGKVGLGADPEAVLFIQSPLGKQTRIEK